MERNYTLPYDSMYVETPKMYIDPAQSRYHNLGLHAFVSPTGVYPGKRPGFVGDYGPRQQGCSQPRFSNYPYPLDTDPVENFDTVCSGVRL